MKKNPVRHLIENKGEEIFEYPYLLELQKKSYEFFLQRDRKLNNLPLENQGLEYLFRTIFPIESQTRNMVLEYVEYTIGEPKYTENEARKKGKTYAVPIKARINLVLKDTGEVKSQEIYFGEFPLMTSNGTFIINGAERVVVSQIHRSPGVVFSYSEKDYEFNARLSPDKGSWLEFLIDEKKEIMHVRIDKKRKILVTTFLRVIGFENNEKIIEALHEVKEVEVNESIENRYSAQDVIVETDFGPEKILAAGKKISFTDIMSLKEYNIEKVKVVELNSDKFISSEVILNTLQKETFEKSAENPLKSEMSKDEAINKVFNIIRPGEPALIEAAEKEILDMFFDPKRYDLGRVGRFKINKKYGYEENITTLALTKQDIINTIIYLEKIFERKYKPDDIDHLSNRRVRGVGELFLNQLKKAFARIEKVALERMQTCDPDTIQPVDILSIKPISAVINEFFGTSQLSQYMDQTNPLTELTHKRRLNALGPGGLSRDRAGFAVRDVHHSHYGRICPIETPEGQNIGLIVSLTTYGRKNDYGFLETPYRKVENGVVTNKIEYLTAIEEERYYIAQSLEEIDENGRFKNQFVNARYKGEYVSVERDLINYIDVSPRQVFSVSTSLIPFLEHNDANRALMGSNMQRQAVPLICPESPYIGTGLEYVVARDSGVIVTARRSGEVIYVTNSIIKILPDNRKNDKDIDVYELMKFFRTNQDTVYNQKPIVKVGQRVSEGEVIADGPSTQNGELALGRNLKVAFMPWYGYNFEDAIVISERVVKEDLLTSIHIKEFQIEVRETKLGKEKITREIPNVSESDIKDLDEEGIIRIGARVGSNSILVGKVTPKGHEDLTPEYRLVKSIFGEKASDVKDTSLRLPHGVEGNVINVIRLRRSEGEDLEAGVEEIVKVYVAVKRKISVGDKLSGRHGNKGVISKILPEQDMPFLPDGTPVDIVLNPLGVPSRMNLGQLLEASLGWVCEKLGVKVAVPVFQSVSWDKIQEMLKECNLPNTSKTILYNGLTGEPFEQEVMVGNIYILKLTHMVDDKVHARSTGNYSLVTQQPLGGKAQFGGQRLGEMEVWALEAYGASYTLHEFLTQKSDDRTGRNNLYHAIVKGKVIPPPGVPEAFNVMIQELKGLCLDITIYDENDKIIPLFEKDNDINEQKKQQSSQIF
ncbi:MAG: DNA-directed RNA polymerase subunit beta [Spirochaetes bacterium]|nr:DNA-directed RNA polymerase subunit beta [Spirochaetota bacterium]